MYWCLRGFIHSVWLLSKVTDLLKFRLAKPLSRIAYHRCLAAWLRVVLCVCDVNKPGWGWLLLSRTEGRQR